MPLQIDDSDKKQPSKPIPKTRKTASSSGTSPKKASARVSKPGSFDSTAFLENLQDAFLLLDQNWRLIFINKKACKIVGIEPGQVLGKSIWELRPKYIGTPMEKVFRKAMEDGRPARVQFSGMYQVPYYEARIYPTQAGLGVIFSDNSEIMDQIETLRQSEKQLIDFLESTSDSFFALDHDWKITYANQRFCDLVGKTPQEVLGCNFWEEFPRYRNHEVEPHYRRAMEERVPVHFEAGGFYTNSIFAITIYPTREGLAIFSTDRTEEKKAMQEVSNLYEELAVRNAVIETERSRWQGLVEAIPDEVWVCDAMGRISLLNAGKVVPMGINEFEDRTVNQLEQEIDMLTPEGIIRPADQTPLLLALQGRVLQGEEIVRNRRTGEMHYRQYSCAPIRNEAGSIVGSVAIVRDITAMKQSQEHLEQAHLQTVEILESIGDAFYHLDDEWRFTYINRRTEELWNVRREDLIGKKIWDVFPRAAGTESYLAQFKAMREKRPMQLETVSPIVGRWISLSLYPAEGGLSVYFRDITEERNAREALRISEEKFSLAFANNPAAITLTSMEDGIFMDVNATWSSILGYSREEVIGQSARHLPIWPSPEQRDHFVQELKENGVLHWSRQGFLKKSGEAFTAELSAQLITIQGRKVILSTFIDITEQERIRRELQEYSEKLKRSNQELTDFAFIASHDLQEPLRKVSSFGNQLHDELTPVLNGRQKDRFGRMLGATSRMQDMIQSLLELSRVTTQGQPFVPVDLQKLVHEVLNDMEIAISRNSGKVTTSGLPTVSADPIQMRRLFMNLIANALKYHRAGVPPMIKITGRVSYEKGARQVAIRVEDNGIGFDMQDAARIFQPFNRLNGRGEFEGTGMGLAISKRIVERHSGSIFAESVPGQGSTFTVILPVA